MTRERDLPCTQPSRQSGAGGATDAQKPTPPTASNRNALPAQSISHQRPVISMDPDRTAWGKGAPTGPQRPKRGFLKQNPLGGKLKLFLALLAGLGWG